MEGVKAKEFTCKEGLLLKEEQKLGKWKKRWMVLRVNEKGDPSLYYYQVDDYINECMPLGFVIPSSCTLFEYPAKNFSFELVSPPSYNGLSPRLPSHFRFQATNTEEYKSWMSVLGLYTMPIEEMHNAARSGADLTSTSHSSESAASYTTSPLTRSPNFQRLKNWENNEAVLIKLFPDVQLQAIVDALEFCHGNRNDAIDLLAEQNKLSNSTNQRNLLNGLEPRKLQNDGKLSDSKEMKRFEPSRHISSDMATVISTPSPFQPINDSLPNQIQKELLNIDSKYPNLFHPSPAHLLPSVSPVSTNSSIAPSSPSIISSSPLSPRAPSSTVCKPKALRVVLPSQMTSPVVPPLRLPVSNYEDQQQLQQQKQHQQQQKGHQNKQPSPPAPSALPPSTPTPPSLSGTPLTPSSYQSSNIQQYSHYVYYNQHHQNYQPLISPHSPNSNRTSPLIPRLSLQASPVQTTPISPLSPQYTNTSSTPTSPTAPSSPSSSASPRLHHQFTNYHYPYRQTSSLHNPSTIRHFEAYSSPLPLSPEFEDTSSYHSHSHPHYSHTSFAGYANYYQFGSPTLSGFVAGGHINNTLPNLGNTSDRKLNPITFRIVGATRNTYHMDYVVEIVTPELRWLVYRRYSNFAHLNSKLTKMDLAHPSKHVLPPKQFSLPPLASPFASDDLVNKRIEGLGAYLNSLVEDNSNTTKFFLSHPIGQAFIDPHISSNDHNKFVNNISNEN